MASTAAQPSEPPPPYTPKPVSSAKDRNGIPISARRSMEDERRELPSGWVRQYDAHSSHQFFVETTAHPPRSIWHHPYDDDAYLATLSVHERERVKGLHPAPSKADIEAESTDDDDAGEGGSGRSRPGAAELPPRDTSAEHLSGPAKFGRHLKDKLTGSTHTEREKRRRQRAEEERKAYEAHVAARRAMTRAAQTGEPQLLGRDRDGHEIYIEPPPPNPYAGGYGGGFGGGIGGLYPGAGYRGAAQPGQRMTVSPYANGVYGNPNARFIQPQSPYGRPYGGGYGGGLGLPLLGGLGGGLLLGGLLF